MDRDRQSGQPLHGSVHHAIRSVNNVLVRRQIEEERQSRHQERISVASTQVLLFKMITRDIDESYNGSHFASNVRDPYLEQMSRDKEEECSLQTDMTYPRPFPDWYRLWEP